MPIILYEYKAINSSFSFETGLCFAENDQDLLNIFQKKHTNLVSSIIKKSRNKKCIEKFTLPFFRSMHSLILNKVNIILALNITMSSLQDKESKAIIEHIIYSISNGLSFSKALSKFDKYFDLLTVKTIEISEKTASLADALQTIISHLENITKTKNALKNSLRYPLILVSVVLLVTLFWVFFIIPTFADLFNDLNIEIPIITKAILKFRHFCINHYYLLFIIISSICGTTLFYKQYIFDKIPFISAMKREAMAFDFFSGMHVLLKEKIDLLDALDCINATHYSGKFSALKNLIKNGNSLSNSMEICGFFSNSEIAIIKSGEKAGALWPGFKTAEEISRNHIKNQSKKIINLIQPLSVLFIGCVMLIIVYSVLVPLYSNLQIN